MKGMIAMPFKPKHIFAAKRWCSGASSTLNVLPFDSIPGPPGKGLPFIGQSKSFICAQTCDDL